MGGMTRLLLLLWAGVTVGSLVDLQKRIIKGKTCPDTERGYHVFLTLNDEPYCSGSLISEDWILTAAHCWEPEGTIRAVFGRDPKSENKVTITEHEIHEDKNGKEHDIMLLKLPKPTKIPPVLLPVDCDNKPKPGDEVKIAGYLSITNPGQRKKSNHVVTYVPLRCATTKIVQCDAANSCVKKSVFEYPHLLCYQDSKVDSTPGDSGGAVVVSDTIYGVVVSTYEKACKRPAASMDVCLYMDWIGSIVFDPKKKCGGCAGALKKICQKYFTCG